MQIFFHLLKFIAIACLFTSFSGAAPKAKFVVAYPNLKIKKPVWVSSLPGTDKELIVSQMGTIHELPKSRNAKSADIWFDLTSRVQIDKDFEEGLLGLIFHPNHKANHKHLL